MKFAVLPVTLIEAYMQDTVFLTPLYVDLVLWQTYGLLMKYDS